MSRLPDGPGADAAWVGSYLVARGLVDAEEQLAVAELAGGVSGEVFEVRTATSSLIVKRALAQLRVAATWRADQRRIVCEGDALRLAGTLAPANVPAVVDLDEEAGILVMQRAPEHWREWRSDLFDGRCETRVATELGGAVAIWHRETAGRPEVEARFGDRTVFVQLRLEPFHGMVAAAHPRLAGRVGDVAERLRTMQVCLVHGDLSPKNVLQAADGVWLIDWEVAHVGDPVFDLAFLVCHLALKAVHGPAAAGAHRALAASFLDAYAAAGGPAERAGPALAAQVGCLLLARVDGKSPANYLTASEQLATRQLGTWLLCEPTSDVLDIWENLP